MPSAGSNTPSYKSGTLPSSQGGFSLLKKVVNFLTARINLNKIDINQSFFAACHAVFSLFIEEIKSILLDSKRVLPTETN